MSLGPQIEPGAAPFRPARLAHWRGEDVPLVELVRRVLSGRGRVAAVAARHRGAILTPAGRGARPVDQNQPDRARRRAERFAFAGETMGVGRDPANEVVLPEATITRHHARLRTEGARFVLEDLGSVMGTIAGGTKLISGVPVELADGESFVIFPYRFQLEVERDWLPSGDVAVSSGATGIETWGRFQSDCPAGGRGLTSGVEPGKGYACLALEGGLLAGVVERALPSQGSWSAVEGAVTEVLLLAMLERVNRDLALPFRFSLGALRRRADLAQDCRGIAMCATLAIQDLHGWARAFLPFELLRRMQAEWALRSASSLADQAAWRFRVSAGSLELTAEEQASIDPGDIVLYSPEPALLLPADDRAGWGAVLDAPRRLRLSARKKTDMPASTERPIPFRKLPLRFQVVVDEHELTLAEVEKLTPGAVLDLGRDPAEPIRLAVNGHVVGTGELIEIEGRMGVRILSWSRA